MSLTNFSMQSRWQNDTDLGSPLARLTLNCFPYVKLSYSCERIQSGYLSDTGLKGICQWKSISESISLLCMLSLRVRL